MFFLRNFIFLSFDFSKTFIFILENYESLKNGNMKSLIESQRIWSEGQNVSELKSVLPTQSIYYKESIIDSSFDPKKMKGVLTSTFVKGHNRPDLVSNFGMLEKENCIDIVGGKVIKFENFCREVLFNCDCLPKYGA